MYKIKRCAAIFLGAALLTVLLAAALPAAEITYMTTFLTFEDRKIAEVRIDIFEKENPGVKVKRIEVPFGDYHGKYLTMVAGGVGPDVFWAWSVFAPEYWKQRTIYPLDEFIAADPEIDWDDFMCVTSVSGPAYDGKIAGFPDSPSASLYLYNKDMFQEAGLADPVDLWYQEKWNWDTYIALAPKLSKDLNGDGVLDAFVCGGSFWWNVFNNVGATVYNPEGTKCVLDSPEARQALQFLVDEVNKYSLVPPPQFEAQKVGITFQTGRVALWSNWEGSIFSEENQNLPFNWGAVMPWYGPRGPEHANAGGSALLSIGASAPDKALAYKFVKCAMSDKTLLTMIEKDSPPSPKTYSQLKFPELEELVKATGCNLQMVLDIVEQGTSVKADIGFVSIAGFFGWSTWVRELNNAIRGDKTVEQACQDAAVEIQAYIDEKLAE